ncbi:MAG: hypothetical protein ACYDCO_25740 [Armatimonadota bacterium]
MRALWFRLGLMIAVWLALGLAAVAAEQAAPAKKPVAALLASWFPNSHPEVLIGRVLRTYSMDGKGEPSQLQIASVYLDRPQKGDFTDKLAAEFNFPVCKTIEEALTLGTGKLAVGGVFLCTEWADYPKDPRGATLYPHRQMFDEVVKVFKASGQVVPVFVDKHLAHNWEDSWYIYKTAKEMKIPLMAGSTMPVSWRIPATDVKRDARLKEILVTSYHTLDAYGFHGLEILQCLAERRKGGETGIASVQALKGDAVWEAAGTEYDPELLADALQRNVPPLTIEDVKKKEKSPVLFIIKYKDGTRGVMFGLNYTILHWSAAWRYADNSKDSTIFWLHEEYPFATFTAQMKGLEAMYLTGTPTWPAERTLLASGILDAGLNSLTENGRLVKTPYMAKIKYKATFDWSQPADPLAGK